MREQVIRRVKYVLPLLVRLCARPRLLSPHFISIQLRCGIFGDAAGWLPANGTFVLPSFFVTATRFKLSLEIVVATEHT